MTDSIHEFKGVDDTTIAIDMGKVVAVQRQGDRTVVSSSADGNGLRIYVTDDYEDVVAHWREAQAERNSTTQWSDIRDLIASVRSLAESEEKREIALLEMHGTVKDLSVQVGRLTVAVSALKQTTAR